MADLIGHPLPQQRRDLHPADVKEVFEGMNLNDAEIIKNLAELIHENIGS